MMAAVSFFNNSNNNTFDSHKKLKVQKFTGFEKSHYLKSFHRFENMFFDLLVILLESRFKKNWYQTCWVSTLLNCYVQYFKVFFAVAHTNSEQKKIFKSLARQKVFFYTQNWHPKNSRKSVASKEQHRTKLKRMTQCIRNLIRWNMIEKKKQRQSCGKNVMPSYTYTFLTSSIPWA